MRALLHGFVTAVGSLALAAQAVTPEPFETFTPGTVAQDMALSPKGGWTYIVGSTTDPNYPTTADAFDRTCGTDGMCNRSAGRFEPQPFADVVLTVFDATGEIQYSTFLGGAGQDDNPRLAIAPDGTLWLAGRKSSAGFEHGPECAGDLWIARFEYTLRRLEQFLCLGGPPVLTDIALDPDGTLWLLRVAGGPASTPMTPTTANAYQPNFAGQLDMFVVQISPSSSEPMLATYIGGSGVDMGAKLAFTPVGDVAIIGSTNSTNFPLVRPLKTDLPSAGRGDAAILVMDRSGRFVEFSTYWGGSSDDAASGVSIDASGHLYVTGPTASADLPTTPGAFDTQCEGGIACRDAYVVKINAVGELLASTFLGGSGRDSGSDVAVRPNGSVMVLGMTQSPNFPLVGAQPFQRWTPGINLEHTWLGIFDDRLQHLMHARFVGSDTMLPSVPRFFARNSFAYVAGQVTASTGAPATGTYLGAVPVP